MRSEIDWMYFKDLPNIENASELLKIISRNDRINSYNISKDSLGPSKIEQD